MSIRKEIITVKISFSDEMMIQKLAIDTAIYDWNKLYSEYHNKELLMKEERRKATDISCIVKNADLTIYVYDKKLTKEILKNILEKGNSDFINLEILSKSSAVFFMISANYETKKYQMNKMISEDLINLISEKINTVENSISKINMFDLFNKLNKNQLNLLEFAINNNNLFFYPKWTRKETINKLEEWGGNNMAPNHSVELYEETLSDLAALNLLDVAEYTEYGNAKLYKLPYSTFTNFIIYNSK